MGARRFCSRGEIADRANAVSFVKAWDACRKFSHLPNKSFSYSLETRKLYDGDMPKGRKDLVELHCDGGTLYIIAPWGNPQKELDENGACEVCEKIIGMGYVPFIGIWNYKGQRHEEPSFAIDHGVSKHGVWRLLEKFGQDAAYCVRHDRAESVGIEELRAGP